VHDGIIACYRARGAPQVHTAMPQPGDTEPQQPQGRVQSPPRIPRGRYTADARRLLGTYRIDNCLTALHDNPSRPRRRKLPPQASQLVDACYPTVSGPLVFAIEKGSPPARCIHSFPSRRFASGSGRSGRPKMSSNARSIRSIRPTTCTLLTAEHSRISSIFPDGVCDYSRPVSSSAAFGTWAFSYGDGEFTMLEGH